MGETCLVNSIVVQAWEAAHGRRRDLVIGITGLDGFRAHAWLEGDPVPEADDAGDDASMLHMSRGEDRTTAPEAANGSGEAANDAHSSLTRFNELLRRPAPYFRER
jgi:hypothetical protein